MPTGLRNGTRPSAIGSERRIDETGDIMTATLDVTDLRKQFAIGRPAIDGVSFAVPAGEIAGDATALAQHTLADAVQALTRPSAAESLVGPEPHDQDGKALAPEDLWGHDHL